MIPARVAVLALTALLLVGVGAGVALTRDDGDDKVQAGSGEVTTTTPTVEVTTSIVTTTPTPTTTALAPATTIRRTTTTARPAATTTTKQPTTSTTVAGVTCTPAQIKASVASSKASYGAGEVVEVTSTLANSSTGACTYNGYGVQVSFRDDAGRTFPAVGVIADSFANVPLAPGAVITHSAPWDHRACPTPGCGPLPSGPYYVTFSWTFATYTYDVSTSFILT